MPQYYGRRPVYIYSYFIYLCLLAASALSPTLAIFLVVRLLSGYFASVTIANFGGTIADLYHPHDTGPAMSLYLWAATCGSPSGFFIMSFVAHYRGWRDVFWALLAICGSLWLIMTISLVYCGETRHSIILARRAEQERKESGNEENVDLPAHLQKRSTKELFRITLSRPFRFLGTEAIIIFAALFNGYLYGLSFLFNTAFTLVFGQGHGFSTIGVGTCFLGLCFGISLGPVTNIWQEKYYQRKVHESGGKNVPEARVEPTGKIAAIRKFTPRSNLYIFDDRLTRHSLPSITPLLCLDDRPCNPPHSSRVGVSTVGLELLLPDPDDFHVHRGCIQNLFCVRTRRNWSYQKSVWRSFPYVRTRPVHKIGIRMGGHTSRRLSFSASTDSVCVKPVWTSAQRKEPLGT